MKDSETQRNSLMREAAIPLESVLLFMAGITMLITGALLFPVSSGRLDYNESGLYGLLLVFFAVQTITMGKTPFGEARRSIPVLVAGVLLAVVGIATCFVPDLYAWLPRLLLSVFFGLGGLAQLLRMLIDEDKFRTWKRHGGLFDHLIAGCAAVYLLQIGLAALILCRNLLSVGWTAVIVLAFGVALVYLAAVIWRIYSLYVEKDAPDAPGARLNISTDNALMMVVGMYMFVLGILLMPVNMGLLPFSGSAQLGLLMVLFAIQMLALGATPLGQFRRSWPMILAGLLFASLGVVSCVIPEVLVSALTYLIGALNVLGGSIGIIRVVAPLVGKTRSPGEPLSPIRRRLDAAQLIMNALTVLFGVSMLISGLIPGLVLGGVLAANGAVLLYMFYLIAVLENPVEKEE